MLPGGSRLGVWCKTPHPSHVDVIASAGVDYVIADLQHGAVGIGDVLGLVQGAAAWGCKTFARVAVGDHVGVQRLVDIGVDAVIIPGVEDSDGARAVARLFDYPPDGDRSRGTTRASFDSSGQRVPARPLCLALVESGRAVDDIDSIVATPGVDGVYVGPVDLGMSLGTGPRNLASPVLMGAIERVEEACNARGASIGTGADSVDEAAGWIARGYDYVTLGTDWGLLRGALTTRMAEVAARTSPPATG